MGSPFTMPDAISRADNIEIAERGAFHISGKIPLSAELSASAKFPHEIPDSAISDFRGLQVSALEAVEGPCPPTQELWDSAAPIPIREASSELRTVTTLQILRQIGLGGDRRMKQFKFGLRIDVELHRKPFPGGIGRSPASTALFGSSGFGRALPIAVEFFGAPQWRRHMEGIHGEVGERMVTIPTSLDADGVIFGFPSGAANTALRFDALQMDRVRALDDFKYGRINLRCATRAPTKLPTWCHLGVICWGIIQSDREWPFSKWIDRLIKTSHSTRRMRNFASFPYGRRRIPKGTVCSVGHSCFGEYPHLYATKYSLG